MSSSPAMAVTGPPIFAPWGVFSSTSLVVVSSCELRGDVLVHVGDGDGDAHRAVIGPVGGYQHHGVHVVGVRIRRTLDSRADS